MIFNLVYNHHQEISENFRKNIINKHHNRRLPDVKLINNLLSNFYRRG